MTTAARRTQRTAARSAAKNGSSKSKAARAADKAPPEQEAQQLNAVVIHRVFHEDGIGFSCVSEPVGDVRTTEVETIIGKGLQNWCQRIEIPRKEA